jgi:hypothetical protein
MIFSVLVLCTQPEYDVCDITLSVYTNRASFKYPNRASLKNMPGQAYFPSSTGVPADLDPPKMDPPVQIR